VRNRWLLVLAAFIGGGLTQAEVARAQGAQPVKALPALPTIEVRVRSANDLLGKADYIGGLVGQEAVVKQVREFIKDLSANGKGIEGIDPKQPFGFYATLTADIINSPFTIMIPIVDQDTFLTMLKIRADITPEKVKGGLFKASAPVVNDVYFRFANDYVYIARSIEALDLKVLPTPAAFFPKTTGSEVGSAIVRFDTIPPELTKFFIGQIEVGIAEQRKQKGGNENAAEKAFMDWFTGTTVGGIKTFIDDAKELNVRVFIDEKADDLSAELSLTAKPGSTLAKNIASLGGKTSLPAGIVGISKDAAIRVTAKAALPASMKKELGKLVDTAIEEIVKQAGDAEKDPIERVLKTLAPTLKAGELDIAVALQGPDAKGRYTLVVAGAIKEGKDIEKLVKDFAPFLGEVADIDFDVEKIGDFTLHTVAFKNMPPDIEKIFGSKKAWVAISEDHVAFSMEPDGTALKAGLKAKPVAVPAVSVEVAAAKLVPLIARELKPDELKAMLKDTFGEGSPAGKDTLSVTITGGETFTVKGKLKGKVVGLVASFYLAGGAGGAK